LRVHQKLNAWSTNRLDASGWQTEGPVERVVKHSLDKLLPPITVKVEGWPIQIHTSKYEVKGVCGFTVPVYLLDCNLPKNTEWDRTLTHCLYGGDSWYRLYQETVLGIGECECCAPWATITLPAST